MLTLYVSMKQKKLTAIWKGFFSWGDILFLLAVVPLFPFEKYILYFTFGTCISLLIFLIDLLITKKVKTIPYAGNMSLVLIGFYFVQNQLLQLIYE